MPLNPNDWWVHAQSTRDLADRMLVRGDRKGAEAMVYAAVELEKRHSAAITISPFSAISEDAVVSFDESRSPHRSAVHSSATTINGRTSKAASDAPPPPRNIDALDPEMPLQPRSDVHDMPVLAFTDFSPTRGVSVEPLPSDGLADLQPALISPEPPYGSSLRRFLLGWTANLYARLRPVVEILRQRELVHFVVIRAPLGGCTLRETQGSRHPIGLIEPKTW
jgi:hypothetical protein